MSKADNTMNKLFTPISKFRLAVALLLVGGCLVACSSLKTGIEADAAPLNPKDAANTPDAVPTVAAAISSAVHKASPMLSVGSTGHCSRPQSES